MEDVVARVRAVAHAPQQAALVPPWQVVQRGPPVAHAPPEALADEREQSPRAVGALARSLSELAPRGVLGVTARALRPAAFEEHVGTPPGAAAVRRHARTAAWAPYVPQAEVLGARMQRTERAQLDGRKSQALAQHASPVPLACVQQQEGSNVLARQTDDFPRLLPFLRRGSPADDGWRRVAVAREPHAGTA